MCVIGTASDCKVCFTCISTGQHSDIKVICYKQIFPNKFLNPNGLVLGGTIKKKKGILEGKPSRNYLYLILV